MVNLFLMKTKFLSLTLPFLLIGVIAQGQPFQMGMNYVFTAPTGGMKQNIRNGNGFVASLYWTAPTQRVSVGFEMNFSVYGQDMSSQDYTFPDGTIAPMNVQVTNNFANYMGALRLYARNTGLVRPYAEVKAGYANYSTQLLILDPDDTDSCEPVEREILKKDGTMLYSLGGGLRLDLAAMSKHGRPGRAFLDFSVNANQGGRVNYMNTDAPSMAQHRSAPRSNDLEVEFINTDTQVVHKHHVGYVYNSFIQATDVRMGLMFTMGCRRSSQTME
jgi:hypothetical protein